MVFPLSSPAKVTPETAGPNGKLETATGAAELEELPVHPKQARARTNISNQNVKELRSDMASPLQ